MPTPNNHRYNPWDHAAALDLRILYRALPGRMVGYYERAARTIVLDSRQRQSERRCTLAHELVHFERGDVGCTTRWHNLKQEWAVSQIAARRLIRIDELARAIVVHQHRAPLAEELWVDLDTLAIRLDTLTIAEHLALERRVRAADRVA